MAELLSNDNAIGVINTAPNIDEARGRIEHFYEQYHTKRIPPDSNDEMEEFLFLFYEQILNEVNSENYEQLRKYNRTSFGLYSKIIKELKKNPESNLAFNLGRIIGSSQIAYKITDELYTEKIVADILGEVSDRKDMKTILFFCYDEKRAYNKEICKRIKVQPNNLNKKMKFLIDLDLVRREQVGREVYYILTRSGKRLVVHMRPQKSATSVSTQFTAFKTNAIECTFANNFSHMNNRKVEYESVRNSKMLNYMENKG